MRGKVRLLRGGEEAVVGFQIGWGRTLRCGFWDEETRCNPSTKIT